MFDFANVVSSDCTGQITLTNIPSGRWRFAYQVYHTASEADTVSFIPTVMVQDGIYFNWGNTSNIAFNFPSAFQSEYSQPTGIGNYFSVISSVSNSVFECYFTASTSNEFTLQLSVTGSFPAPSDVGMNALFTLIKVGPYIASGNTTHNFVDDEIAGGPPPG